MKKQIKEIYQMIRGNLRSLLLFEFFFRFIAGTLLVQVGTRGLKFCLDRAGYSYLTLANAMEVFSPTVDDAFYTGSWPFLRCF